MVWTQSYSPSGGILPSALVAAVPVVGKLPRHFLAFVAPEARDAIPDPQALSTFEASKPDWSERERGPHAATLRLYQALVALRRIEPALRSNRPADHQALALDDDTLLLRRGGRQVDPLLVLVRLRGAGTVSLKGREGAGPPQGTRWQCVLQTEDPSFALDPAPPQIDLSGPAPVVRFLRPAAVVLRGGPEMRMTDD